MTGSSITLTWAMIMVLSIAADACATAYLKVAGDRVDGGGFFTASVIGVVAFGPSIMLFGYAIKVGPSYIATVGMWAVGVYTINAILGIWFFGDSLTYRTILGVMAACLTVVLLKPT